MTPRSKITIDEFVARELKRKVPPRDVDINFDIESGMPRFVKIKRRKNKPK